MLPNFTHSTLYTQYTLHTVHFTHIRIGRNNIDALQCAGAIDIPNYSVDDFFTSATDKECGPVATPIICSDFPFRCILIMILLLLMLFLWLQSCVSNNSNAQQQSNNPQSMRNPSRHALLCPAPPPPINSSGDSSKSSDVSPSPSCCRGTPRNATKGPLATGDPPAAAPPEG